MFAKILHRVDEDGVEDIGEDVGDEEEQPVKEMRRLWRGAPFRREAAQGGGGCRRGQRLP
jgi:hypothetical protein